MINLMTIKLLLAKPHKVALSFADDKAEVLSCKVVHNSNGYAVLCSPMGMRQLIAFLFCAALGLTPPSQAMGVWLMASTPPAKPTV